MKEYLQTTDAVLDKVGSSGTGLTGAEAAARLEKNGKNKLAEGKRESVILRFLKQLVEPMTIILLVAAAISAVLAVYEGSFPSDVVIIMAVVVINAVLGVVQESKAEEAIAALQEMSAATSKVLRDGKQVSVHSEDLVVGDVIILEAGDAVPADARLLECASMKVEEAALTGESVPRACLREKAGMCRSATASIWFSWVPPSCTVAERLSLRQPAWVPKWARLPPHCRRPRKAKRRCRSS